MKKLICFVLVLVLTAGAFTCLAENDGISITIDGKNVEFTDAYPTIIDGRTMVPMRALAEAFGASVEWDEERRVISVHKESDGISVVFPDEPEIKFGNCNISVYLKPDKKGVEVKTAVPDTEEPSYEDGSVSEISTTLEIDVAPIIINSRTYLPARCIASLLGYDVSWDADTRTVVCTYNGKQQFDFGEMKDIYHFEETMSLIGAYLLEAAGDESREQLINDVKAMIPELSGKAMEINPETMKLLTISFYEIMRGIISWTNDLDDESNDEDFAVVNEGLKRIADEMLPMNGEYDDYFRRMDSEGDKELLSNYGFTYEEYEQAIGMATFIWLMTMQENN